MAKQIVYRSKNESDWEIAKKLLEEAGIEQYPFVTEEVSAAGCGSKIDPRKFLNGGKAVPSRIYRIEVERADKDKAEETLRGKVQPVRSYGYAV